MQKTSPKTSFVFIKQNLIFHLFLLILSWNMIWTCSGWWTKHLTSIVQSCVWAWTTYRWVCVYVWESERERELLALTPELVIVCAALSLATTVAHLTAVLFIVHAETKLLPLSNKHKHWVKDNSTDLSSSSCTLQALHQRLCWRTDSKHSQHSEKECDSFIRSTKANSLFENHSPLKIWFLCQKAHIGLKL